MTQSAINAGKCCIYLFVSSKKPQLMSLLTCEEGGTWMYELFVAPKCIYGFMEAVRASAFLLHVTGFVTWSFVARIL